jgi:hypothetical protein
MPKEYRNFHKENEKRKVTRKQGKGKQNEIETHAHTKERMHERHGYHMQKLIIINP